MEGLYKMKIGDIYIEKETGDRFTLSEFIEADDIVLNPDMSTKEILGKVNYVWFSLQGSDVTGKLLRKENVRKIMKKEVK